MTLRGKLATTQREIQQQERQLNIITVDQDRLRKNLKEMPPEAVASAQRANCASFVSSPMSRKTQAKDGAPPI